MKEECDAVKWAENGSAKLVSKICQTNLCEIA